MTKQSARPAVNRNLLKRVANPLPDKEGWYFWTEWKANVHVLKQGRHFYVMPPIKGGIAVRITDKIAGEFVEARK